MTEQTPNIYALLIGINHYEPNLHYTSLNGAVGDINLVDDYLKETVNPKRIWKLTAPNPDVSDVRASQEANILPTYENILKAFNEITETAQRDDLVYIHYSGHGGRAITTYEEIKGKGQYDEAAIVPMDIGNEEDRYIRDVEMTTLLQRMTDKGLIVTVILDSCHSGGATRGDVAIRSGEEDDSTPRSPVSSGILGESREKLIETWNKAVEEPQDRDPVVLAACRATEFAYEAPFEGKKHGALTYWMINTLKSGGSGLTFKSLSDRVTTKIQSKFRDQLPMLQGQDTRFIFGSGRASVQYAVTVGKVDKNNKRVTLNAGMAQGLSSGTRLAIYPLNTIDFADKQKRIAIVEVTEDIQASSALAKILDIEEAGIGLKGELEEGAPATILSAPPDLVRRVHLFGEKKLGDKDNELPTQELVDNQQVALAAVRKALEENGWVVEVQEGEHYQVAIGKDGEYEICTGMPLKNLKSPMIDNPDAPKAVVDRLIHLAKYQAVQELDNSNSELENSLEFELCDVNKQSLPNGGKDSIRSHNERVYLRVKNISREHLNIAVLDLAPDWAISQFPVLAQEGQFFQLVAGQEVFIGKIRLVIPEGEGYEQGAPETFKLFATRGPADFRWLKLPPIDQSIEKRGSGEATRGIESPLGKLLQAVGEDPDTEPSMTRAVLEPDPSAEFVTKQIQFTIKH